jgi:hypothetical protein
MMKRWTFLCALSLFFWLELGMSQQAEFTLPVQSFQGSPGSPSLPTDYPHYSGLDRLARMEKYQSDLCNEEIRRDAAWLLERYEVFVKIFEGDDPTSTRDEQL